MAAQIAVELQLFARMRELCGNRSRLPMRMPEGATPEACFERLREEFPGVRSLRPSLAVAVNEEYALWDRRLADGDEVCFIPPVSGG